MSGAGAVLAPGYGGSATQAILVALGRRLGELGVESLAISYSRPRPTGDFTPELDDVRRARDELRARGLTSIGLVGRSFGGRMVTRLAATDPPTALVLLGHPISPPRRPRPDDETALAAVRCPTLIVQGEHDALGPLDVLERIAAVNRVIELDVLPGVGHQFGKQQATGVEHAAVWLAARLQI
jgi:predicted alpha/beta-hydrolase family hydrolase